jgi:hypothetical protein
MHFSISFFVFLCETFKVSIASDTPDFQNFNSLFYFFLNHFNFISSFNLKSWLLTARTIYVFDEAVQKYSMKYLERIWNFKKKFYPKLYIFYFSGIKPITKFWMLQKSTSCHVWMSRYRPPSVITLNRWKIILMSWNTFILVELTIISRSFYQPNSISKTFTISIA